MSFIFPNIGEKEDEGYKRGKKDFIDKIPKKNPLKFKELFTTQLWSKSEMKAFLDAYQRGYEETRQAATVAELINKKNLDESQVTQNLTNNDKNNKMDSSNDRAKLERQRELVVELIQKLNRLIVRLDEAQRAYSSKIDDLEAAGLVSNFAERFRQDKYEAIRVQIQRVSIQIEENDIRYLNVIQGKIEEGISKSFSQ